MTDDMKRITIIIAAICAAYALASCTKEALSSEPSTVLKKLPTVDIRIGDITGVIDDGVTTKAAKTGWAVGDKVNIWFDQASHKYGDEFPSRDEHFYPELIMTYNGSSWDSEFSSFFDPSKLKTNGPGWVRVLYESRNDITKFSCTSSAYGVGLRDIFTPAVASANHYMTPMIVVASANYSYDAATERISASVTSWQFLTKIQVLVTGLAADKYKDESYYMMSLLDENAGGVAPCGAFYRLQGFQLMSQVGGVDPYGYDTYTFGTGGGTKMEDGMAFYFYDTVNSGEQVNYTFRVSMFQPPRSWVNGSVTFENKTITTSPDKITCIRFDRTKLSNSMVK